MNKDLTAYAYWSLNIEESGHNNGTREWVVNCSNCGYRSVDEYPNICPSCGAIMVEPLGQVDMNGHDICEGDIITCNISGHEGRVTGKVVNDGQWHLENPVGFRWMYNCKNIEVKKGIIPKGKYLSRECENKYGKTH